MQKNHKILFTGGGTGGSVSPLLAIAEDLNEVPPLNLPLSPAIKDGVNKGENKRGGIGRGNFEFLWLGTKYGPEKEMVERVGIKFKAISGGKWRRYFSWYNFVDIFKIKLGFWQSFFIILTWRPDLVISAGSFVSVPVIWSAWLFKVPIIIHQQDVKAGLANKLMAPFAKKITVTFAKSLKNYGAKAVWTGNPVRKEIRNSKFSGFARSGVAREISELKKKWGLKDDLPIVLIIGGGTGALSINKLVEQSLVELTKFCQVILISGKKKGSLTSKLEVKLPTKPPTNFQSFEFLNAQKMAEALKLADLVVTRAGMSFLTELSYLAKPTVIIPLPDSHQEENARMFKDAAIVLNQKELTKEIFINQIKNLLDNETLKNNLSQKIKQVIKPGSNQTMVRTIQELLNRA